MNDIREVKREILRGDIIMADLSPCSGSEYSSVRPCLVVQNNMGNKFSPTVTIVPLTSVINKRKLPTHVIVEEGEFGLSRKSTICAEGIRTIDKKRFREYVGKIDANTMHRVENAIMINLGMFS